MWNCTLLKLDEEKSTYAAGVAQENGVPPAQIAQFAEAGKKRITVVHLLEKSVINMIESDAPCFWLVDHNNWSRWFAICSSDLLAIPVSVLCVGLQKSK